MQQINIADKKKQFDRLIDLVTPDMIEKNTLKIKSKEVQAEIDFLTLKLDKTKHKSKEWQLILLEAVGLLSNCRSVFCWQPE